MRMNKPRLLSTLLVACILLLLSTSTCMAAPYVGVYGTVVDESRDPIPEVDLTFTTNSTGLSRTITTWDDGTIDGKALSLLDWRTPESSDPAYLVQIYEDGVGDKLAVVAQKDGYKDWSGYVYPEGDVAQPIIWLNITMEKEVPFLFTMPGMVLVASMFGIVGLYVAYTSKKESEAKKGRRKKSKKSSQKNKG